MRRRGYDPWENMMGAETVTYALTGAAQRNDTVGLTTVFPGCPMVEQAYFDIMAALRLANANNSFAVCDNSLKVVLDANPNLWRIVVGGLHYYLPEQFDPEPQNSNNAMCVDSAGRWYLGGDLGPTTEYLSVVRLNPDLSIDTTWGDQGWWLHTEPGWTGTYVQGVEIDPATGKVLIGAGALGSTPPSNESACCMRINTDGTTDTTFNGGNAALWTPTGCNRTLGFDVDIQSDGKVVVCGASIRTSDGAEVIFATRLNSNGAIDTTFGTGGHIVTDVGGRSGCAAWGNRIDSTNRCYLGGVCQETQNATLTAAGGGGAANITLNQVTNLKSGTFITVGSGATQESVIAQTITGNTITTYPILSYNHAAGEAVTWEYGLQVCIRIANGQLDTTFNGTGYNASLFGISDDGLAIDIQSDGKPIVVGGVADSNGNGTILTRYNFDGTMDTTFGSQGNGAELYLTPGGSGAQAVAVQPDDKIVVGVISGPTDTNPISAIRFNANGTPDTNFADNASFHYPAKPSPWLSCNGIAVSPTNGDICVSGPTRDTFDISLLYWAAGRCDSTGALIEG